MAEVTLERDLAEFFRGEVFEARSQLGIELSEHTEFYLVNLLCDFTRTGVSPSPGDEPLALLYKRALESSLGDRLRILKELGDVALYVSGFFVEFIERSLVDLDYYISMGGNAYRNVSGLMGRHRGGDQLAALYGQLAGRFTVLVNLLNEVADRARDRDLRDRDVLRLYERWLLTRSERLRQQLIDAGVLPIEPVAYDD
jgi:hypothetical protein